VVNPIAATAARVLRSLLMDAISSMEDL